MPEAHRKPVRRPGTLAARPRDGRYTFRDLPDVIAVTTGSFADPTFPMPTVSVYDNRRHPWLGLPDGIERN